MKAEIIASTAACVAAGAIAALVLWPRAGSHGPGAGVSIGGPFVLSDGGGHQVTDRTYRGRYMLVYFGYTHCPDACPTTLNLLANALDHLPKADQERVVPIFITVDPARDTPSMMAQYVGAFGPEFVGLTGTDAQIKQAEGEYHVYAARHELRGGDYAMDHSSIIYVMRPDGSFAGIIPDDMKSDAVAQRLLEFGV